MDSKKRNIIAEFIKFNIVGITNTVLTYLLYSFLVFVGVHHILSLSADYTFGIVFSFILNKTLTFKHKEKTNIFMFLKMVLVYVVIYSLNVLLLYILIDTLHYNKYVSQLFSQAGLTGFSFFFQKMIVFRTTKKEVCIDGKCSDN